MNIFKQTSLLGIVHARGWTRGIINQECDKCVACGGRLEGNVFAHDCCWDGLSQKRKNWVMENVKFEKKDSSVDLPEWAIKGWKEREKNEYH